MSDLLPIRLLDERNISGIAIDRSVFTVVAAGETLGVPIASVRTIFRASAITPIPLAPPARARRRIRARQRAHRRH